MSTPKPRAAIYCRISRDAEQEGLGVARQEEDCRALVARRGLDLVAVHVDNDLSASAYGKKRRPAYADMLAAVRARQVDVIVAYDDSRLTRKPREKEDFIDLVEKTAVKVFTVASGDDDLTTADGKMLARVKAGVSANHSDKMSERLRRKFLEKAQQGKANQGARPFGWGDDKKRLHPKEARLLRRAVEDVIDGVPTREVARRWNAAGATTTRGKEWTHTAVRQVLRNPRLAGWRVHQRAEKAEQWREAARAAEARGEAAPPRPTWRDLVARDAGGEMVRGEWTPMVNQQTFEALQAALDGRQPKARRGARKYLLSGVTRCGVCGSKMHGSRSPQGHNYTCGAAGPDHTCAIAGVQTDALLAALVEQRLAEVDLTGEPAAPGAWEGEARLAQIPRQVMELMDAYRAGTLSAALVFPQVEALEAEQAALEAERPAPTPRAAVVSAEAFGSLDPDRQRAVVESLVASVVVGKADYKGARWAPGRLEVVWRS